MLWLLVYLAGVGGLYYTAMNYRFPIIQGQLISQIHEVLSQHGVRYPLVQPDGLHFRVSGKLDNSQDLSRTDSALKAIQGVRSIKNQIGISEPAGSNDNQASADKPASIANTALTQVEQSRKLAAEAVISSMVENGPVSEQQAAATLAPDSATVTKNVESDNTEIKVLGINIDTESASISRGRARENNPKVAQDSLTQPQEAPVQPLAVTVETPDSGDESTQPPEELASIDAVPPSIQALQPKSAATEIEQPIDTSLKSVAHQDLQRSAPEQTDTNDKLAIAMSTFDTSLIQFEVNSARLTAESEEQLQRLALIFKAYPTRGINIVGHTDASGDETTNQEISEARALAVAEYLVAQGIEPLRLQAFGYGESAPIADNDTPEGRARNRRIEFQF